MSLSPAAGVWNVILVFVAAVDLAAGSGKLAGAIVGGMIVSAALASLAARFTEAVVEALPLVTGFAGTVCAVFYWMLRVKVWLDQHLP